MPRYCPECGEKLAELHNFCPQCGVSLLLVAGPRRDAFQPIKANGATQGADAAVVHAAPN